MTLRSLGYFLFKIPRLELCVTLCPNSVPSVSTALSLTPFAASEFDWIFFDCFNTLIDDFDFYFAERHTTGSNFSIETSLDLVTTPPVPEPETYALMLAGLGLVGFMTRRRRKV